MGDRVNDSRLVDLELQIEQVASDLNQLSAVEHEIATE